MKKFTKLALASSVALSANAMAMQAMDDAALSATTGQDGISIGIGISKIQIEKLFIHDTDGYTSPANATGPQAPTAANPLGVPASAGWGGTDSAAAIVIYGNGETGHVNQNHGIVIGANYDDNGKYLLTSRNLADLKIDSDAGGGNAFINIAASVSGLDINIGKIGVQASGEVPGADADTIRRGGRGDINDILSGLSLKTGPMTANIQLGAAPQGAMIKLNATMLGGLEILDLGILDNSTKGGLVAPGVTTAAAGEIFIESIKLSDANSRDLTLNQSISVFGESAANDGFIRIVSTSGAHDTYVAGVHLGSRNAASIGDVEVQGMQTYYSPQQGLYVPGAIITIKGH